MKDQHRGSLCGCACCDGHTLSLSGAALTRRHFVMGAAALAAAGAGKPERAAAQTAEMTKPYRIDVHHHLSPPTYIAASNASHFGDPLMKNWTPEKSLEDMDGAGVEVAILSVTAPGLGFTSGEAARKLARECNDYAARLVADHHGRFGSFAMIPLTDIDGSLQEIAYALDTLKADGIGLLTSYGDKWLGDPAFLPVMEELNRRKALVYTHPTLANCCVNLVRTQQPVMIEYGTDTTRTIADIIFSGNAFKIPRHPLDILPCRRDHAVPDRALCPQSDAGAECEGDGAGRNPGRAPALLLRYRADLEQGLDVGAVGHHSGFADRVRHRLPVPDQYRPRQRIAGLGRVHRGTVDGYRTRQCAETAAAVRGLVQRNVFSRCNRRHPARRFVTRGIVMQDRRSVHRVTLFTAITI
jgi:hypothetical protein